MDIDSLEATPHQKKRLKPLLKQLKELLALRRQVIESIEAEQGFTWTDCHVISTEIHRTDNMINKILNRHHLSDKESTSQQLELMST